MIRRAQALLILLLLFGGIIAAQSAEKENLERHRLYTKTLPSDTGGIKGVIVTPRQPIVQILAMPPEEPRFVYEGKVIGADKCEFIFESLPMAVYDLFVIYNDDFFEGLELHPHESTLTLEDLKRIETIITESQPYFTKKIIHRVEGTTGRGNFARCVVTYLRDKASSGTSSHREGLEYMVDQSKLGWRRTFKLVWLKDVGPGWQIVQTRDLYPIWTGPAHAQPKHHYSESLSHIRVTDKIKDLGRISLSNSKVAH
jgi:hypothetical protein